jgi:hypothetical protein
MSAAAASVVALAAAPALAATTWTVKPGGSFTAKAGTTTITDTTLKLPVTCTSSAIKGKLKAGSKLSGTGLGTVSSIAFTNCASGELSLTLTGTMPLNATAWNATKKVATMTITKIHGTFTVSAISCTATIDGTSATAKNGMVTATFTNGTDTLKVSATGGNLHLYNVSSGCTSGAGIHNKDAVNFTGSYKVSPKQTITG